MKLRTIIVPLLLISVIECRRESRRDRSRHNGRRAVRDEARETQQGTCELEISCKGDTMQTAPVKLPIKGPRGPPGKAGNKGEQGEPGMPGREGRPGHSSSPVPKVGFFVGLGNNVGPVENNVDLLFDRVITNVGGAFNNETGRFTAPFDGVYYFSVVVAAQGMQKAAVMLVLDGEMIETIWAESIPYWATSSNNAILELRSGQQVWIVLLKRAPYIHGYMYSSFSGYSLFKNDDPETKQNNTEE